MSEVQKLVKVSDEWNILMQFLEWLSENGIILCKRYPNNIPEIDQIPESNESLLYKYFKIDPTKVELERRELLASLHRKW